MDTSVFKSDRLLNKIKNILKNDNIYYGKILSGDKFVSNLSEKEKLGLTFILRAYKIIISYTFFMN